MFERTFKAVPFVLVAMGVGLIYLADQRASIKVPGLIADSPRRNFGTVRPSTIHADFPIRNAYSFDVEVISLERSCGCTSAKVSAFRIPPGVTTKLSCDVDLHGHVGAFTSTVIVKFRPANKPAAKVGAITCAVSAYVEPIVQISPGDLRFTARVSGAQTINISFQDPHVKVLRVSTSHRALRALLSTDGMHLSIMFDGAAWPLYDDIGNVTIYTSCPSERAVRIPVFVASRAHSAKSGETG